ncbi:aminotransferase class I/II-fold pyridoxal phosphate-dependent enzyme [Francisella adeliensis]|uniref:Aminotransferase n=1 Tax=Francisella adeliensis TaxID=2007306 RepID=A0A2Z4XYF0_9GAMM|nr:aminotransferase class I/II-fold pyridoxal phosphate-dependent enzyme [Francisella adeliensis]AXA33463.1 aminotransferase [Francisella adeliensis]MBK2085484.1 aminotransferase class I/II-fold pyridoxal phosphate-dependent enzyme [Francisella adeliensis]MBK2097214.1 aminotransferase class I/II-fold pyridoxal phosphate-dependent enzyme [Francisella adeliensis]QIW11692.1 aminotransferase class I/II-fold pyridoxal phosphate-dependent enzyme [Francisella adeliensis]QIW13566.1 aminotransferase cl
MPKLKPQIDTSPSVYAKFATMANEHKAVNFTQGAPDFDTPEWLIDRANFYMKNGKNQYSPIPGAPALRKAMIQKTKQRYGVNIEFDNITITAGAQEGLFAVISSYVGKDDEVIMFDPIFDTYAGVTNFNQGKCVRLNLLPNGRIDTQAIANAITDKTKIIILNSPHNPMGTVISKVEFKEIANIIKDKDILVISDEVYEHIYAGDSFTSAIQIPELRNKLVVLQSLGKTYNLTGWRLGVAIAPSKIIKEILYIKQFSTFSAVHPMQLALADGIVEHPEYYQNLHSLYKKQNQLLREGLKNSRFKVLEWQGSPFQVLDYSNISNENDHEFATNLIKEHGVGLIPISTLFEKPQNGLLRLCFAKKDDDIIKGAKILSQI